MGEFTSPISSLPSKETHLSRAHRHKSEIHQERVCQAQLETQQTEVCQVSREIHQRKARHMR